MRNTMRMVSGLAFTAMLVLSLMVSAGEADARSRPRSKGPSHGPAIVPTQTFDIGALGVTWE